METMTVRKKNFDFSFGYVFASSRSAQFHYHQVCQEKKLSMIKIFKLLFVSNHLKRKPVSGPVMEVVLICGDIKILK